MVKQRQPQKSIIKLHYFILASTIISINQIAIFLSLNQQFLTIMIVMDTVKGYKLSQKV